MLDLNDPEVMKAFCNTVAIAKVIYDEWAKDNSYENLINISDELYLTVEEVQDYLKIYNYVSKELIL